ncbi:MAG: TetR/AcrR family transcriptional regulator [Sphingobium sp.]
MKGTIKDQVRNLKRESILDVSSTLFFEQGYHGTSIESICAELSVTKPFIYYHFTKKDDILHAIYLSSVECALESIRKARETGDTPQRQIILFVEEYVGLATSKMQPRIALNSREKGLLPKEMMRDVNHAKRVFLNEVTDMVRDGAEAGAFDVATVELAAQSLLGLLNWVVTWYRPGDKLSPEDIARDLSITAQRMMGVRLTAQGDPA